MTEGMAKPTLGENRGNAGKGRVKGSRNKVTSATLALLAEGESPLALLVKTSKDENQEIAIRLNAARWAAPYLHSKPFPEMPTAQLDLPDDISHPKALQTAHESIMRAVAGGELPVVLAKDLSGILETHRRILEVTQLEQRISALEKLAK